METRKYRIILAEAVDVWPSVDGGVDVGEDVRKRFDLLVRWPCSDVGDDGPRQIACRNGGEELRH